MINMKYRLFNGDCLEEHQHIEDGAVDLILYDLPFGTMKMKEKNGNYFDLHFYSTYMSSSLFRLWVV